MGGDDYLLPGDRHARLFFDKKNTNESVVNANVVKNYGKK